jgi:oxygen-dependent protoporphyrinogen oxidase
VKAVTLFSQKWGWAPDLPVVVRASVGRYGEGADLVRDDVELAGVVAAEICDITGFRGRVLASRLTRWEAALPQYRPGHPERTLALRRSLPARLVVAGAAYDGVGIPACIRSGRSAARDLCEALVGD